MIYTTVDQLFYCASSLKQHSMGRHIAPLRHIVQTYSHKILMLLLIAVCLSVEAENTCFVVFE
jgi:hypothetical protein